MSAKPTPLTDERRLDKAGAPATRKYGTTTLSAVASKPGPKTADAGGNQHRRHEIKKNRVVMQSRRQQRAHRQAPAQRAVGATP